MRAKVHKQLREHLFSFAGVQGGGGMQKTDKEREGRQKRILPPAPHTHLRIFRYSEMRRGVRDRAA